MTATATATATAADLFTTEVPSVRVDQHELSNGGYYYQVDSDSINMARVIGDIFGIEDEDVSEEMLVAGEELGLDRLDGYAHDLNYGPYHDFGAFAVFANERLVAEVFGQMR